MKKLHILVLTFIFILTLVSCENKTPDFKKSSSEISNGKWELVDPTYDPVAVSLSDHLPIPTTYKGKTLDEIWDEAYQFYNGGCYPEGFNINWGEYPILSPDGKTAVYSSNKDCYKTNGQSIFLLEVDTGEEKLLISPDGKGEYYGPLYWLDDKTLICNKLSGEYIAYNMDGKKNTIKLKGKAPIIVAWNGKHILYAPDLNSNKRYVATIQGNKVVEEGVIECSEGDLACESAINPYGTKVALKIYTDRSSGNRVFAIYDMNTDKLYKIDNPKIEGYDNVAVIDIKWEKKYAEVNFYIRKNQEEHNELWKYIF